MSPSTPGPLNLRVDHLAGIVLDESQSESVRSDALRTLRPFHILRARCIMRSMGRSDPATEQDLAAFVEEQLWFRGYDPTRGRYTAWCNQVLRNRLIDLSRTKREEPQPDTLEPADRSESGRLESRDAVIDWRAPFSENDLERIRRWRNNRRRIILLCRSLLWMKVPPSEWETWLVEAGILPPFPPDDFCDWDLEQRIACLAEALHTSSNNVNQNFLRGRDDLMSLAFVRGLRDDS